MSVSTLSNLSCRKCGTETLHKGSACIHCGSLHAPIARPDRSYLDSSHVVRPPKEQSPPSKSRRQSASESGMPVRFTAGGDS